MLEWIKPKYKRPSKNILYFEHKEVSWLKAKEWKKYCAMTGQNKSVIATGISDKVYFRAENISEQKAKKGCFIRITDQITNRT